MVEPPITPTLIRTTPPLSIFMHVCACLHMYVHIHVDMCISHMTDLKKKKKTVAKNNRKVCKPFIEMTK